MNLATWMAIGLAVSALAIWAGYKMAGMGKCKGCGRFYCTDWCPEIQRRLRGR